MATDTATITGLILCGGAGSRMGGIDKGLVLFHGKPLVDIAIARLAPQVGNIIISANRNLDAYGQRGHPVIKDDVLRDDGHGYEGPLAGILSGMAACDTSLLMVVPCDAPMFPLDVVARLHQCMQTGGGAAHVREHPTFALIDTRERHALEQFLQHGQRKLGAWLSSIGSHAMDPTPEDDFRNLNSPQDLAP